jgi:hypothetical protein
MAHTEGEWEFDDMLHIPGGGLIVAKTPNGPHPDIYLAAIVDADGEGRLETDIEKQRGNGRLMAAAPKLRYALQACVVRGVVPADVMAVALAVLRETK